MEIETVLVCKIYTGVIIVSAAVLWYYARVPKRWF